MATVLVIDDAPFWRNLVADALRARGFAVLTALEGLDGLATLRRSSADLIILDVEMPQMSGFRFLEELRGQSRWVKIPVIMLTGNVNKADVLRARKLGAVEYLLKDRLSLDEMLNRVRRQLSSSQITTKTALPHHTLANDSASPSSNRSAGPRLPAAGPAAARATDSSKTAPRSSAPKRARASSATRPPPATVADLPQLLTREQSIQRAAEAMHARSLSGVAAQVVSMSTSQRANLSDLASVILRDSVLCARLLKAANSAASHSGRVKVSTIPEAVRVVGCAGIRDIAASLGVFDAMPPCENGFHPIRCWQHSFAVATLCSQLVPEADRGTAYLVGLCHDLGKILFRSHFAREYDQVAQFHRTTGKTTPELERVMLGVTQTELVETILGCLGLPEVIQQPIIAFHRSGPGRVPEHPLARALQIADLQAIGALLAPSGDALFGPIPGRSPRKSEAPKLPMPTAMDLRNEVYALTCSIARLSPDEEAKLLLPLYPHRPVRLFLARDPSIFELDPVTAALEAMADVTVAKALPEAESLNDHQALAVIAQSASFASLQARSICRTAVLPGGQRLPVLWLVAGAEGQPTSELEGVEPIPCPVSLCVLDEFAASIPQTELSCEVSVDAQRQAA
jgi:CheY-like chemotaxis protein